ncbi:uncharacterized protein ACN2A1_005384 isoform 1-T1 [Glossina fuscipes fuscipes]
MAQCYTIYVLMLFILSLQLGKAFTKAFLESTGNLIKGNHKQEDSDLTTQLSNYNQPNLYGSHTYSFGYEINNKASGNIQFRNESKYGNNTVQGSYGYVQPDQGLIVTHHFTARADDYSGQMEIRKPVEEDITSIVDQINIKQNLTDILLPVEPIKAEQGINLNPAKLEQEVINPVVLETIDGALPLKGIAKDEKGFENLKTKPVHKFIPTGFPIIPFQLPTNYTRL